MSSITAADPRSLLVQLEKITWPRMEPLDKDEFLSDIMDSLDLDDDLIAGTLGYLARKRMPPRGQIEAMRDLYQTTLNGDKEKLENHRTYSEKNKLYINEVIALMDKLSAIAAQADTWIRNNLQELSERR